MNWKLTYIIPFALALAACSSDHEPSPPPIGEDNPVYMSFSVSVENPSGTRAGTRGAPTGWDDTTVKDDSQTWGDDYINDKGTDFDCALLGKNFTPLILEADGTKAGEFNILSYWKTEGTTETTYTIHGSFAPSGKYTTVEQLQKANGLKLMLFANTPTDPMEKFVENKLHEITFPYISDTGAYVDGQDDATAHGFEAVPMWGVTGVSFENAKPGSYTLITPKACSLLRAMAKVTVQLDLKSQRNIDCHLVSLELNKVNPTGNVVPQGWSTASATTAIPFASTINENTDDQKIPTRVGEGDEEVVTNPYINAKVREREVSHPHKDYISFYLPEISNSPTDYLELTVNYTVAGVLKSNHLYFTPYSAGGPIKDSDGKYKFGEWDIVRNHIYEFTITGVQDSKITIEACVKDWTYHKSSTDLEE